MNYKMQLLVYRSTGGLVGVSDLIPIGSFIKFPVKEVMSTITEFQSNVDTINLSCGLLPLTIESESLLVLFIVLDETIDPIRYSELYIHRQS